MSDSAPRSSSPARATTSGTAWPVCDQTTTFHDASLKRGGRVKRVDVRYRLEGTFNAARDNVVLVVHHQRRPVGPRGRLIRSHRSLQRNGRDAGF